MADAISDNSSSTHHVTRINKSGIWKMLNQTFRDFSDDGALRLSAALAYYALLSLAPLLLLILSVAGLIWGRDAVSGRLVQEMGGMVGNKGAEAAQLILSNQQESRQGIWVTLMGIIVLVLGATGVFLQLQDALNIIWDVRPQPGHGIRGFLRSRLISVGALASLGFMFLISLAASTALSGLHDYLGERLGSAVWLLYAFNLIVSLGLFTLLFAAIFKFLPDVLISWRDVWIGALFTAIMFVIGKYLIGLYLGRSSIASAYGAAGSIVVFAIWSYYACLIMFLGAEFTQVFAQRSGREVRASEYAERIPYHNS